ncbi:MAG: phosphoenolpyruvate--protein phosphotransferase [Zoogloea sp.]|nr:phosphoenolpyruvate--protein phosphotransferase [Zoogloea sp.]
MSFAVHGLAVSQGIAIGYAHLVSHALLEVHHYTVPQKHVGTELERLSEAVEKVRTELVGLKAASSLGSAPNEMGAFVDLHRMLLDDPMLVDAACELIRSRGCNAEWALVQQMDLLLDQFDAIEDAYLRERKSDVVQVVERLVKVLLGHPGHLPPKRKDGLGTIVVAHDLSPTDTIGFKEHAVAGFVTDVGGPTGHTAIVARSLSIPAVVALHHIRHVGRDNELLIIDGTRGVVIVNPDQRVLEEYRLRRAELELERSKLKRLKSMRAATLDGEEVQLLANIGVPPDAIQAKAVEADGIGLFRSEFLFMSRVAWPDEDEQFESYRAVLKTMAGRPVTVRTLDIGADKAIEGANREEDNPALGLRAIRYCLAEPKMFLTQLRALLRASQFGKLKILVPMLAHAHELDQTLVLLERAKAQLREAGIKFDENVPVGGMIEVPAAALCASYFVRRLQFLSIGTNDLIQYTLAIDRGNEAVAHLYEPLHPAVLRLIAQTIQVGAKAGVPVSVCGEMAGDPDYARLLIGMGLRQFSMHPSQILEVKQEILRADGAELGAKVSRLLKLDEPERVKEAVARL